MARMRHLKPEFFRDRKMAELGPEVALVYQALWCVADDGGTAPADPVRVWGEMFVRWPAVTIDVVARAIVTLAQSGRLRLYRAGDETYGVIPTFPKHQKPKNPSDYRYPVSEEWLTPEEVTALLPQGALPTPVGGPSYPSVVSSQVSVISDQVSGSSAPNENGAGTDDEDNPDLMPPGWSTRAVEIATAAAYQYQPGRFLRILRPFVRRDGLQALAVFAEFLKFGRRYDEQGQFLATPGPATLLRPERFRDSYDEWKPSDRSRPA